MSLPSHIVTFLESVPEVQIERAEKQMEKGLNWIKGIRSVHRLPKDQEIFLFIMCLLSDDEDKFEMTDDRLQKIFRKLYGLAEGFIRLNLDRVVN